MLGAWLRLSRSTGTCRVVPLVKRTLRNGSKRKAHEEITYNGGVKNVKHWVLAVLNEGDRLSRLNDTTKGTEQSPEYFKN